MFLQYFRPQLYSGDTACRIWGHPGFIPEPARCTLRTSGHPWLHSGTRPSAFGDAPASFRDTAFRTLGHPGFIPGHTHCNPEPHPGVQPDPAGNAIRYCRKYRGSSQKILRRSSCRQSVTLPPVRFHFVPKQISAASSITL